MNPGKGANNRNLYGHQRKDGELYAPTRLTEEVFKGLVEAAELGATMQVAAHAVGISPWTLGRWIRESNVLRDQGLTEADDIRIRLATAMQQARARRALEALENLRKAGKIPQHWTAAAWYLERTYPELYGRQDRVPVDWKTQLQELGLSPEAAFEDVVKALLQAAEAADRDGDDDNIINGEVEESNP